MRDEPLLSIHPKYAEAIFSGSKTVEFRRRSVSIPESGRIWIYATRPTAGIVGYIQVTEVVRNDPSSLWHEFASVGSIEASAFDSYFAGCDIGFALVVGKAVSLDSVFHLDQMREAYPGFTPPQFYIRNTPTELLQLLDDRLE